MVQYDSVATVLHQCDTQLVNVTYDRLLNSNAAFAYVTESDRKHKKINKYTLPNRMTREQVITAKNSFP